MAGNEMLTLREVDGTTNHLKLKCVVCNISPNDPNAWGAVENYCDHVLNAVATRADSELIFTAIEDSHGSDYCIRVEVPMTPPPVVAVPVWLTVKRGKFQGMELLADYHVVNIMFATDQFTDSRTRMGTSGRRIPERTIEDALDTSALIDTYFLSFLAEDEGLADIRSMVVDQLRLVAMDKKELFSLRSRCYAKTHKTKQQLLLNKILAQKNDEKTNELLRIYLTGFCSECTRIRSQPMTDLVPNW